MTASGTMAVVRSSARLVMFIGFPLSTKTETAAAEQAGQQFKSEIDDEDEDRGPQDDPQDLQNEGAHRAERPHHHRQQQLDDRYDGANADEKDQQMHDPVEREAHR